MLCIVFTQIGIEEQVGNDEDDVHISQWLSTDAFDPDAFDQKTPRLAKNP